MAGEESTGARALRLLSVGILLAGMKVVKAGYIHLLLPVLSDLLGPLHSTYPGSTWSLTSRVHINGLLQGWFPSATSTIIHVGGIIDTRRGGAQRHPGDHVDLTIHRVL